MSQDFFLQNRAHQIGRLCGGEQPKVDAPQARIRSRLPEDLQEFYALIDRIRVFSEQPESEQVTDQQREDMRQFEQSIVRLRFSSDDSVKQPAVQLIKAIFADADYFSGLKPLPQYTDVFAYELLFPSWLNLLTATMLPQAKSPKPRLEGKRQAILFEFLGKVAVSKLPSEDLLVGLLTFVASRFNAPVCEELLQRFVELYSREGAAFVDTLGHIEQHCKDARQFQRRIHDYLTVKHSLSKWPSTSEIPISYKRPLLRVLPKSVVKELAEFESKADWDAFFELARPLRQLIHSDHLLESEFLALLDRHPDRAADYLRLVIHSDGDGPATFMPPEGQICLAHLIEGEAGANASFAIERVQGFSRQMAPRLEGYKASMLGYFCRQFINDSANRELLLEASVEPAKRQQLASFLLQRAEKLDDDARFLELLACVTVISPDEQALTAKTSIQAIDAVVSNRSIGNKEFSDLVSDLQANVSNAIEYLATPILAAAGKSPRLASLYMTLNEISETFGSSGKADNFSVVRAKYSALTNFDDA